MSSQAEVAVLTACFGGCDDIQPQAEQDIAVDWVAVTDGTPAPSPWGLCAENANGSPNLSAKRHKLLPSLPHRYVIWVDSNIQILSPSFVREALTYIQDGLALHAHPFRDCVYQEGLETILTPKYDAFPIADQIRHYEREDNHPLHGGLYACGVIAWDREHPKVERLGQAWFAECERWSVQDQLSFPVVCRRLRIKPGTFPYPQYQSPWLKIYKHRK